jgi:hypothetical protein
MDFSHDLGWFC